MSLDGRDLAVQYLTVIRSVETCVRMQFCPEPFKFGYEQCQFHYQVKVASRTCNAF